MCLSLCGLDLRVAENLPDDGEVLAGVNAKRAKGVPEIMYPDVADICGFSNPIP